MIALPVEFLSTLPARGATKTDDAFLVALQFLSTLPARGATEALTFIVTEMEISIHAPREGSDVGSAHLHCNRNGDFYPRSPRGERRQMHLSKRANGKISIHAPREGSDIQTFAGDAPALKISIHAPREGSDPPGQRQRRGLLISIHAPREGSDSFLFPLCLSQ